MQVILDPLRSTWASATVRRTMPSVADGCSRVRTRVVLLLLLLGLPLGASTASAEECGNGTTFDVRLPNLNGRGDDMLTLPDGCRIYALLVSGYSRNAPLDELSFYNLAKFVMEQDGYVHWAWWNNLLKEYMARPLHLTDTVTLPLTGAHGPTPGGLSGTHALGFAPFEGLLAPKAVPEEDHQFQSDASRMLTAIRARNPDAIIIVVGHSMGGAAVARLGTNPNVPIDVLAPIDPVGNRSDPVGRPTGHTYNWTRWRATRTFRGIRRADCVRNSLGLCRNFGTFLQPRYTCGATGGYLDFPVVPPSFAPLVCPTPYDDRGTVLQMGGNVKRLYHRWQTEAPFPFDVKASYYFGHWAPLNSGSLLEARNIQRPVLQNAVGESDPQKTCAVGLDPRDDTRLCNPGDGHGEIVGFRTPTPGRPNPEGPNVPIAPLAAQARAWAQYDADDTASIRSAKAAQRRQRLLAMRGADENWGHRPVDPDLCMVSDDLVAITRHLLSQQPAPPGPPTTTASVSPETNADGWHNDEVMVTLVATPAEGREVESLVVELTGAQSAPVTTVEGTSFDLGITAEGETTVRYYARGSDGQEEAPTDLVVRVDTTPPDISAVVSPAPDAQGWHTGPVTVTFDASDPLSGVATVAAPVVVSADGSGQEVVGTATDLAGNTASVVTTLNLDASRGSFTQSASTWLLAEGADNAIFTQEVLVGNPSLDTLDVTLTLLPQPDAIATHLSRTFTLRPTSRLTVRPRTDFGLNGSSSLRASAVVTGTSTPADIVVERTMYFSGGSGRGAHNAGGVAQPASSWTLAEGATTIFDTFVLVANGNETDTHVRATYLTGTGEEYVTEQHAPADGRVTFWPRAEHQGLRAAEFSTFVESLTPGNDVIAERAMYFDGLRAGHDAVGIAAPATTWFFAEGFTGGNAQTAFETFLLLANTGQTTATVTIDYLLDSGDVVTLPYTVPARSRFTVWVDQEGRFADTRLAGASFGLRITADQPIVAERAMYWGVPSATDPTTPLLPWNEGHATAGATEPASRWAFAEGAQGELGTPAVRHDSFFLLANPNPAPIAVRATFVREDGHGVVRESCVGAHTRANIWTATHPELAGHRFATFLEAVASTTCGSGGGELFVAERAMYLGPGFGAGHVNMGTPWPGVIAQPPE